MKKIIKKYVVLSIYILSTLSVCAQSAMTENIDGLPYNIPTPTASNLGQFGLSPVSLYTGKADISIPIYTIDERGVKMDIRLVYDTSGLLVNQLPGWTGHGWSLMAGGSITRKVNGQPDELEWVNSYYGSILDDYKCYFKTHKYTAAYLRDKENMVSDGYGYLGSMDDFSADVFYFNFMGKSGRFWLGNDGEWKVLSDDNLCVEFDIDDKSNYIYPFYSTQPISASYRQPKTIKGFTIIDEDGTKYKFGGDVGAIEYSTNLVSTFYENYSQSWEASTWMLTSVSDRFGNELYQLNYFRDKFIVQLCNAYFFESYSVKLEGLGRPILGLFGPKETLDFGGHVTNYNFSATLNSPVYLESIQSMSGYYATFKRESAFPDEIASHVVYPSFYKSDGKPNGNLSEMLYNAGTSDRRMPLYYLQNTGDNVIKIFQANPDVNKDDDPLSSMDIMLLKSIRLDYNGTGLFNYTLNYDNENRVHLTSVDVNVFSANNNRPIKVQTYSMEYYKYAWVPKDYLTKKLDYWGYYNGIDYDQKTNSNQETIRPFEEFVPDDRVANRAPSKPTNSAASSFMPSEDCSKYGMLTKITYPTGGYMTIDYEQNKYSKNVNDDRVSCTEFASDQMAGGLRIKKIACYDGKNLLLSKQYKYELQNGKSSGVLYSLPKCSYVWNADIYPYGNIGGAHEIGSIATSRCGSVIPLSNSFGSHIGYSRVQEINSDESYTISEFTNASDVFDDDFMFSFNGGASPTPYDNYSERGYMWGKLLSETKYDTNGNKVAETLYEYTSDASFNASNSTITTNMNVHRCAYSDAAWITGTSYKMYYPKTSLAKRVERNLVGGSWIENVITYVNKDYVVDYITKKNKVYKANVRSVASETHSRGNDAVKTSYIYSYNDVGTNYRLTNSFYLPVTCTKTYLNNKFLKGNKTSYGVCGSHILPMYEIAIRGNENVLDTIVRYKGYYMSNRSMGCTGAGRLADAYDANGIRHMYFWNGHDKLVAIADNSTSPISLKAGAVKADDVLEASSGVFGTEPSNVTTCSYNKRGLVSSVAQANKKLQSYRYDNFGRLAEVKDNEDRKLQKYDYLYRTSTSEGSNVYDDEIDELVVPREGYIYLISENKDDYKATINSVSYSYTDKKMTVSYKLPANVSNGTLRFYAKYPKYSGIVINKSLPVGNGAQSVTVDVSSIVNEVDQSYKGKIGLKEAFKAVQIELYVGGELKDTKQQNVDLVGEAH